MSFPFTFTFLSFSLSILAAFWSRGIDAWCSGVEVRRDSTFGELGWEDGTGERTSDTHLQSWDFCASRALYGLLHISFDYTKFQCLIIVTGLISNLILTIINKHLVSRFELGDLSLFDLRLSTHTSRLSSRPSPYYTPITMSVISDWPFRGPNRLRDMQVESCIKQS